MIKNIKNKIKAIANYLFLKKVEWKDIEYFDESWKRRISMLSSLIPPDTSSIMDLGCGKCWLKEFIKKEIKYYPVDYKKRSSDTIVCDFNKKEFPNIITDVIFCSGIVEYIEECNLDWFFNCIRKHSNILIISYCSLDLNPSIKVRKSFGWKNHFTKSNFVKIIEKFEYTLVQEIDPVDGNNLFKFHKKMVIK